MITSLRPSPLPAVLQCACNLLILLIYRGDEFRIEFSNLGAVRSLIPSKTNIMALTATATRQLQRQVITIYWYD